MNNSFGYRIAIGASSFQRSQNASQSNSNTSRGSQSRGTRRGYTNRPRYEEHRDPGLSVFADPANTFPARRDDQSSSYWASQPPMFETGQSYQFTRIQEDRQLLDAVHSGRLQHPRQQPRHNPPRQFRPEQRRAPQEDDSAETEELEDNFTRRDNEPYVAGGPYNDSGDEKRNDEERRQEEVDGANTAAEQVSTTLKFKKRYGPRMYADMKGGVVTGPYKADPRNKLDRAVARFNTMTEKQLLPKVSSPMVTSSSKLAKIAANHKKKKQIEEMRRKEEEEAEKTKQEIEKAAAEMRALLEERRLNKEREEAEKKQLAALSPSTSTASQKQTSNTSNVSRDSAIQAQPKREKQKTMRNIVGDVEGCEKKPYLNDDYEYVRQEQPPCRLEWPGYLLTHHTMPESARDISTFLDRERESSFDLLDPLGRHLIEQIDLFREWCGKRNSHFSETDFSVVVRFREFPPQLGVRSLDEYNNQLRPILIDGCAVAYSYNNDYLPKWTGPTKDLIFTDGKLLPMYPIVNVALRMILLGHKVKIILPQYYQVPYYIDQKQLKVDNLYAFVRLESLGLLEFLEPSEDRDMLSLIQESSNQTGACILGHDVLEFDNPNFRMDNPSENDPDYEDYNAGAERNRTNLNVLKVERIQSNASERILSVDFPTHHSEMVIYSCYYAFVGIDASDHANRRKNYRVVDDAITLKYTEVEGDIIDYGIRVENQLTFKDQVNQVLELSNLYHLSSFNLAGSMLLLRFAKQCAVHFDEIEKFTRENPPFPEPSAEDIASLTERDSESS